MKITVQIEFDLETWGCTDQEVKDIVETQLLDTVNVFHDDEDEDKGVLCNGFSVEVMEEQK